jgi:transcriptional regulator with XRE-family HTH domain
VSDDVEVSGDDLRKARESVSPKLSIEAAARKLGISEKTLRRWETSGRVKVRDLTALEQLYGSDIGPKRPDTVLAPHHGTSNSNGSVPRDQRIMITEFELEAEKRGAPEFFMDYARDALRNPDNVTSRRYGHDGKVLSAEDQRLKTEQMITKLRALLDDILRDPRRRG